MSPRFSSINQHSHHKMAFVVQYPTLPVIVIIATQSPCDYQKQQSSFTFAAFLQPPVKTCRDFRKPHLEMESPSKAIPFMVPPFKCSAQKFKAMSLCKVSLSLYRYIHHCISIIGLNIHLHAQQCPLFLSFFSEVLLVLCLPMSPCRLLSENHPLLFHFAINCFLKNAFFFCYNSLMLLTKSFFLLL